MIRPPRQRSKAGGLQRRTEVASCAPPEQGKSSAERPRCKHQNEAEPRHGSSSLLAATNGSLRDRLRPAHDRQGCTEYGVAHRQGCFGRCYGLSMLPSTQAANREGSAPSGTAYKPVRSRTTESGDTAQSSWSARCYAELKVLSSLLHGPTHSVHT